MGMKSYYNNNNQNQLALQIYGWMLAQQSDPDRLLLDDKAVGQPDWENLFPQLEGVDQGIITAAFDPELRNSILPRLRARFEQLLVAPAVMAQIAKETTDRQYFLEKLNDYANALTGQGRAQDIGDVESAITKIDEGIHALQLAKKVVMAVSHQGRQTVQTVAQVIYFRDLQAVIALQEEGKGYYELAHNEFIKLLHQVGLSEQDDCYQDLLAYRESYNNSLETQFFSFVTRGGRRLPDKHRDLVALVQAHRKKAEDKLISALGKKYTMNELKSLEQNLQQSFRTVSDQVLRIDEMIASLEGARAHQGLGDCYKVENSIALCTEVDKYVRQSVGCLMRAWYAFAKYVGMDDWGLWSLNTKFAALRALYSPLTALSASVENFHAFRKGLAADSKEAQGHKPNGHRFKEVVESYQDWRRGDDEKKPCQSQQFACALTQFSGVFKAAIPKTLEACLEQKPEPPKQAGGLSL